MEEREEVSNAAIIMCALAVCAQWFVVGAIVCCAIIFG